jgi:hypothetical protein
MKENYVTRFFNVRPYVEYRLKPMADFEVGEDYLFPDATIEGFIEANSANKDLFKEDMYYEKVVMICFDPTSNYK